VPRLGHLALGNGDQESINRRSVPQKLGFRPEHRSRMVAGVQYRASVLPALNPMNASGSGLPPALQTGYGSPSCGVVRVHGHRLCGVATSIPAGAIAVSSRVWVAQRRAVGSFATSLGVIGVSSSAIQMRDEPRSPSSATGSCWATSCVLVESGSNYVRLDAAWIAEWKRRERTRRWSRLAITSCGMVRLLAASCSTFSFGNRKPRARAEKPRAAFACRQS
jgi:hypothetical protein